MGFVTTFNLLAFNFDKINLMHTLLCLHLNMCLLILIAFYNLVEFNSKPTLFSWLDWIKFELNINLIEVKFNLVPTKFELNLNYDIN
jgi:hypothetical protein